MVLQAHQDIGIDRNNYSSDFTSYCHSGLDPESEILIAIRMTLATQLKKALVKYNI